MTTKTPTVPLFPGTDRPLTLEDAHDMAKRGYGPIEIEVYKTGKDGYSHLVRRRSPREICRDLVAVLGEYPEGGEEGIHPFPYYACGKLPPRQGRRGVLQQVHAAGGRPWARSRWRRRVHSAQGLQGLPRLGRLRLAALPPHPRIQRARLERGRLRPR